MTSKRPATKAGREALSVIQRVFKPLGATIEFEENTKHNFIVVLHDEKRWSFGVPKGGNTRADTYANHAKQFTRRVLTELTA